MIEIIINNIISNTRRYKLVISCIEQTIIDLDIFIQKIIDYQPM